MNIRTLGKALLLAGTVLIIGGKAGAQAQAPQPVCKQFVHYDKSNFSITLPTINKVVLGSMSKKSDKIQAAADLTQLFDLVQFSNCQVLDRLAQNPGTKDFEGAARESLDANNGLLALAIAFNAYSKDPNQAATDKVTQTAVSALPTAKTLQSASSQPQVQEVNLDAVAKTFQGDLSVELADLRDAKPPAYVGLWTLITDDKKKAIRDQLKRAMDAVAGVSQLQLNANDLAAFIVMPGGDGQLYFPPGLLLRPGKEQNPPPFSVPKGYGAAGVAFDENDKEFVEISDTVLKLDSSPEAKESQKKARMILIPRMGEVHALYVAAFPIDNSQGKPIAVMTISIYKLLPRSVEDLQVACNKLPFPAIQSDIANLLTFKK